MGDFISMLASILLEHNNQNSRYQVAVRQDDGPDDDCHNCSELATCPLHSPDATFSADIRITLNPGPTANVGNESLTRTERDPMAQLEEFDRGLRNMKGFRSGDETTNENFIRRLERVQEAASSLLREMQEISEAAQQQQQHQQQQASSVSPRPENQGSGNVEAEMGMTQARQLENTNVSDRNLTRRTPIYRPWVAQSEVVTDPSLAANKNASASQSLDETSTIGQSFDSTAGDRQTRSVCQRASGGQTNSSTSDTSVTATDVTNNAKRGTSGAISSGTSGAASRGTSGATSSGTSGAASSGTSGAASSGTSGAASSGTSGAASSGTSGAASSGTSGAASSGTSGAASSATSVAVRGATCGRAELLEGESERQPTSQQNEESMTIFSPLRSGAARRSNRRQSSFFFGGTSTGSVRTSTESLQSEQMSGQAAGQTTNRIRSSFEADPVLQDSTQLSAISASSPMSPNENVPRPGTRTGSLPDYVNREALVNYRQKSRQVRSLEGLFSSVAVDRTIVEESFDETSQAKAGNREVAAQGHLKIGQQNEASNLNKTFGRNRDTDSQSSSISDNRHRQSFLEEEEENGARDQRDSSKTRTTPPRSQNESASLSEGRRRQSSNNGDNNRFSRAQSNQQLLGYISFSEAFADEDRELANRRRTGGRFSLPTRGDVRPKSKSLSESRIRFDPRNPRIEITDATFHVSPRRREGSSTGIFRLGPVSGQSPVFVATPYDGKGTKGASKHRISSPRFEATQFIRAREQEVLRDASHHDRSSMIVAPDHMDLSLLGKQIPTSTKFTSTNDGQTLGDSVDNISDTMDYNDDAEFEGNPLAQGHSASARPEIQSSFVEPVLEVSVSDEDTVEGAAHVPEIHVIPSTSAAASNQNATNSTQGQANLLEAPKTPIKRPMKRVVDYVPNVPHLSKMSKSTTPPISEVHAALWSTRTFANGAITIGRHRLKEVIDTLPWTLKMNLLQKKN